MKSSFMSKLCQRFAMDIVMKAERSAFFSGFAQGLAKAGIRIEVSSNNKGDPALDQPEPRKPR